MDWIKGKEKIDWTVNSRSLSRDKLAPLVADGQQRYKSQRDWDITEEGDMIKALEMVSLETVHHTLCVLQCA